MEQLLENILIDILKSDSILAGIPPRNSFVDDSESDSPLMLVVHAEQTGKSIGTIITDYSITVTLQRTFRQEESNAEDFQMVWEKVIAKINNPPASLPIYSQATRLIFDDIEPSTSSNIDEDDYVRAITFPAYMSTN